MPITRIISGGQTGADRGGLEAALYCEIPHGGWCRKGKKAEKGTTIPAKYELQEHPSADYSARTEANVVDSDCTVIFTFGPLEGGSLATKEFADKHRKPCLHVDLEKPDRHASVRAICEWLWNMCPKECVLNVAGQRASKAPGIEQAVMVRMVDVISKANGKLFYPLREEG